jgi:hypothetical protein
MQISCIVSAMIELNVPGPIQVAVPFVNSVQEFVDTSNLIYSTAQKVWNKNDN